MIVNPKFLPWSKDKSFADVLWERGLTDHLAGWETDDLSFAQKLKEADKLHPTYTDNQKKCWALYSAFKRFINLPVVKPPTRYERFVKPVLFWPRNNAVAIWRWLILLILLAWMCHEFADR